MIGLILATGLFCSSVNFLDHQSLLSISGNKISIQDNTKFADFILLNPANSRIDLLFIVTGSDIESGNFDGENIKFNINTNSQLCGISNAFEGKVSVDKDWLKRVSTNGFDFSVDGYLSGLVIYAFYENDKIVKIIKTVASDCEMLGETMDRAIKEHAVKSGNDHIKTVLNKVEDMNQFVRKHYVNSNSSFNLTEMCNQTYLATALADYKFQLNDIQNALQEEIVNRALFPSCPDLTKFIEKKLTTISMLCSYSQSQCEDAINDYAVATNKLNKIAEELQAAYTEGTDISKEFEKIKTIIGSAVNNCESAVNAKTEEIKEALYINHL